MPRSFATRGGCTLRTHIFVIERRNCVCALQISMFPTRIPKVRKDSGSSFRVPARHLGCAKVTTKGPHIASRRAGESLRATQFRHPRRVHIEDTHLCHRAAQLCLRFANFNVSDANPQGTEGFWLQLSRSSAPSGLRQSDHKRAPHRKPTRRRIPPCHAVSPPEVGAH